MRKILIKIAIVIVLILALSSAWIFGGRQLSLFLDRFGTIEITTMPITSIAYEGSGTGGILHINELGLSLNTSDAGSLSPNIGTTKDNQLALSFGGKVFAFGPTHPASENDGDSLAAAPPTGDDASVSIHRSLLSWPTPLDFNFMTGQSPSWKRHLYYRLLWKKQTGAKLEMTWRYEQFFYPGNGWTSGFMTHEGTTGLIRVDIQSTN
jgi:hypothetical protein